MTDIFSLRDLGLMVAAAALCVLAARHIRMPSIVAYIVAGLVLGPIAGLIRETESVELIADTGIALLLFLVGLELRLDKVRGVARVAAVAGVGQVVLTALLGTGIVLMFGFSVTEALFIATALTFSSTVVVVKLLGQKDELDALYGRIAVGIFLVQDLIVIVVLTVLTGLGEETTLSVASLARQLAPALGGMLLLLAVALGAARFALRPLFGWIAPSHDGLFIWSLCWCFLFVLGAERFQLSTEMGAFLAGISLAQLPFNEDLRRRVAPLMNFFIAVFFVSIGAGLELADATRYWAAAAVLSLFVLVGKPVIFLWLIARMGYGERTAFLTSVTVAQVSEFSFILAAAGVAAGIVDEAVLSLIAVVGIVTMALSAYMIHYNHQLYAVARRLRLLRWVGARQERAPSHDEDALRDHVIVVGINSLGRRIVYDLVERGEAVLALDVSAHNLAGLPCRTMLGNGEHVGVLEEAGIRSAKLLVSALQIEDTNLLLAYWGRSFGVATSIHAFDQSMMDDLRDAGADHLLVSKSAGTRRIARAFQSAGIFE